jgi:very-short-patch-repair endonuclease
MNEGKVVREYRGGESITSLAEKYSTYGNKIRRILKKNNEKIRTPSEAQKLALKSGRSKHPTEGKERSKEEKISIGMGVSNSYSKLSETEKKKRGKVHKKYWKNLDPDEKTEYLKKMNKGRIESASIGSHLERELVNILSENGVVVNFHTKVFGDVEVDLFLPEHAVAVEIDGPTHHQPIWGDDALKKTKLADKRKNGHLLNNNITVLRVANFKNSFAYTDAVKLSKYIIKMTGKTLKPKVVKVNLSDL